MTLLYFCSVKVYRSLQDFQKLERAVVTTGTFDGVHLGHRQILKALKTKAERSGGESVVVTFSPHPRSVLTATSDTVYLLNSDQEKLHLLEELGIQHVLVITFTKEFSQLPYTQYVKDYLIEGIGAKQIVIGYDHQFGKGRSGNHTSLMALSSELGFELIEIPEHDINATAVSSTKIRTALELGDVSLANSFLGYRYMLSGKVVKGKQLGRTIGFPTANIVPDFAMKQVPGLGIYAVWVVVAGRRFMGMLSIGTNPTVGGTERTIEVNILDFSEDIYDQALTLELVQFMRQEEYFDGLEALKIQLAKDEASTREILAR